MKIKSFTKVFACDKPHYPFELPKGWEWTTLGEIGSWQSGATPSRMNKDYYGGNIPWLKTGDLNDGTIIYIPEYITQRALEETSVRLNPKGSVLIAMYGATIGKIGILSFPATTNQACCACYEYSINQMFLFYFLLANRENFIAMGGGGAQPNISKEKIISTNMPLPPLKEQERIVAEIERWLSFVDIVEKEKSDLQSTICLAKSKILDLAIHGKLVPQDPNDEPASELLKRINPKAVITCDNPHYPFELPKGWEWTTLGEIGEIITGNTPSKDNKEYYGGNIPFFKPTDLEQGIDTKFSNDKLSQLGFESSRKLPANTVLVTCIGATIGKTGLISVEGSCNQQINAIVPTKSIIPYFLYYACVSEYMQNEIKSNASATTLPILNKGNFSKKAFPLPPLSEQHRIVAKIEELFAQLDKIEASL